MHGHSAIQNITYLCIVWSDISIKTRQWRHSLGTTPITMLYVYLCFSTRERPTLMPQLPGQRREWNPNNPMDTKARTTPEQKIDDASATLLYQRPEPVLIRGWLGPFSYLQLRPVSPASFTSLDQLQLQLVWHTPLFVECFYLNYWLN